MEEKRKKTEELIKELQGQLIGNSKDAKWAKDMLRQLAGLYQMDKLIDIPLKDIRESVDFGACVVYKVKDGYVFEAKGGMKTHIRFRMARVCAMLNTLFELHNKADKNEDEQLIYDLFSQAVLHCFQSPIFSSLDDKVLYSNATALLKNFNDYCVEHLDNVEPAEETEKDLKENAELEQQAKVFEELANSPLPPED